MKEPIEDLFKQSLGGHEMPYNPDAWTAMRARLDVVSPVTTPRSYWKYYLGAAAIGAVAITSYLVVASGDGAVELNTPVAKETLKESSSTQGKKNTSNTTETQKSVSSLNGNSSEPVSSVDNNVQLSNHTQTNTENKGTNQTADNKSTDRTIDQHDGSNGNGNGIGTKTPLDPAKTNGVNVVQRQKMTIAAIADVCLNETREITNPNSQDIYIIDGLNNTVKTIPANKTVIFKPIKVGNYSIVYKNDSKMEFLSNFQVNRIPDAEFTIDMVNKFENGLPSTHVEAISGQGTYTWSAGKETASGLEADLHFYKKGEQTIELTVNNGQCSAKVEKSIYVEDDYNLMAMTGFTPSSGDARTNTFMPFALTQRNVNFKLTIIDSRDGQIVYETTDATLPWDGTDIRTGNSGNKPQVYVWKAVIFNPAKNEPNEYRGTITMN